MNYTIAAILAIEGVLFIYGYFNVRSISGSSVLDLVLAAVFLALGFFALKKFQNRIFQWITIIMSLIMGPGGYIGIGGLAALLLAVFYMLSSGRSKSKVQSV